ncbi:MAG TPA: nuclear transport factor 2 family protein [Steroidobacteraceae bacterium]|nr:nuclear transport factor 2 family protein [Steroidobacteraceae bacterium]
MLDAHWWQGLFAAIDTKDTARFVAYLTDDAEFRYGSGPPVSGRAAIGDAVDNFFASIEASEHTPGRRFESGDSAICEGWVRYTRRDGRVIDVPFCNVFTLEGDRISKYHIYIDPSPLAAP